MTLLEVLVSALLVGLIAIGTLTGLSAANKVTGNARLRAQATAVAQQNEEQLRGAPLFGQYGLARFGESTKTVAENGLCVESISGGWRYLTKAALTEKAATKTCEKTAFAEAYAAEAEKGAKYTGTVFTIKTAGEYYSPSGQNGACEAETGKEGDTEVIKTTSSITWTGNHGQGITQSSFVKIPPNYGLLVKVKNRNNEAVAGAVVKVTTTKGELLGEQITPSSGCVVFGDLEQHVNVAASKGNWVDFNGKSPPVAKEKELKTDAVTTAELTIEAPGSLTAEFVDGSGNSAESFTFVAAHPTGGMSSPAFLVGGSSTVAAHVTSELAGLFPFVEPGSPPSPSKYTVYAGSCAANNPITVTKGEVTEDPSVQVEPNQLAHATKVEAPAVTVTLDEGTSVSTPEKEIAETTSAKVTDSPCKGEASQNDGAVPYEFPVTVKKAVPLHLPYATELKLCVVGDLKGTYYKQSELKLTNTKKGGTAFTEYLKATGYTKSTTALTC